MGRSELGQNERDPGPGEKGAVRIREKCMLCLLIEIRMTDFLFRERTITNATTVRC